jgi:type IV pilus assembly protein PilQ
MSIISIMALMVLLAWSLADASPAAKGAPGTGLTATITGINVFDDTLEIKGDKAFIYTIYKPSDPYRVLVEIPDADIGTFRDVVKPKNSAITEITPSQVDVPKPVAKIEILLQTPSGVDSRYDNNSLILKVKKDDFDARPAAAGAGLDVKVAEVRQDPAPEPAPKQEMVQAAEGKTALPKATEITGITFDHSAGVVKVVIKGNGIMSPTVFTLKNKIVVDIPDVSLKTSVPSSVMSPVKGLRAGKHKDKTRLVVDLNGTRDFDVLSVKDSIIIALRAPETAVAAAKKEAAPAAERPQPEPQPELRKMQPTEMRAAGEERKAAGEITNGKEPETLVEGKYTGTKISLDFQDSDIVPIFRLLSDISGFNIVVHPDVKGKLSMKLINVPWDQALDMILKTFALGKSVEGNIIRIAPLAVFAKESEERRKASEEATKAEPLETKYFAVNYADVKTVDKAIKDARVLSPRGSLSLDERTRSMIVKDIPMTFPQVETLLLTIDKPTAQVMIEGRIVEINTNDTRDLGIQWGVKLAATNTLSQLTGLQGLTTGPFTGNKFMVDVPANVSGRGSGINFGILSPDRTFGLDLQLSALESIGNTKVISNPKILTVDNGKAKILQGKSIPVRKLTTEGTISTEFKDINIELNVSPHITPDKSVGLDIEIKKEELDPTLPSIEGVPGTDKKEAKTSVIIHDGETIVIGGMYKVNTSETNTGVPGLLKIPILGWLFKNNSIANSTSELLIFITPRIVEKP